MELPAICASIPTAAPKEARIPGSTVEHPGPVAIISPVRLRFQSGSLIVPSTGLGLMATNSPIRLIGKVIVLLQVQ